MVRDRIAADSRWERGHGAINLTLFGSTTHHVVRAASCPVLHNPTGRLGGCCQAGAAEGRLGRHLAYQVPGRHLAARVNRWLDLRLQRGWEFSPVRQRLLPGDRCEAAGPLLARELRFGSPRR